VDKKVGIIGAGVVGTAIGVILNTKGYEITGVYDIKSESTKQLVDRIGCRVYLDPRDVARSADILFITTGDSKIEEVVDLLADAGVFRPAQVVMHMSGAQTSAILDRAKEKGAWVVSVHPLQSFANLEGAIANLPGSVFSIEGNQEAHATAVEIVLALGGEYFFIAREAKPLYHAGACVVSNYLVTLIDLGVKLLASTGIPADAARQALMPLVRGSVNNIEKIGIPGALTGPIARGDVTTINNHLERMREMAPQLVQLYSLLGFYTAPIAAAKGTIDSRWREEFEAIFSSAGALNKLDGGN
jgi:predicted short-subunit dehydrogenase-like oxidoreductase (DUF2520 family)